MSDIGHLHHVGHLVRDIAAAVALYRRMGFLVPPPAFPVLAPAPGKPPRAVGAGNTHITLRRNFVELVTVAEEAPEGSVLVPLAAPPAALERLTAGIAATSARLAAALARSEGLHVLVFHTADADAAAARLAAAGVPHEGVQRVQRPGADGAPVPIGFLELDPTAAEGRLALAEDLVGEERPEHPNGALDLVEAVLCVPDAELAAYARRYERYLARPAHGAGPVRTVELGGDRLTLVAASGLDDVLPGERPLGVLPAFVACTVTVRRLDSARRLLADAGFPLRETPAGGVVVPAAAALGAAVVFRQA